MAHTPSVLAHFQDGETRLVYARNRDTDELFLLPDGEAEVLRSWAKKELNCPVRDCPSPELTTVSRTRGRDGFMHYTGGGGHDLESLFHLQACERIAVWLRANHPTCTVRKEETTAARERRADVMITAPDSRQIAFEIQYAALTPAKWQERHDSYRTAGIVDVWLFGHSGAQLRPARAPAHTGHDVALNPTHEAVVAAGLPLLWFNPLTGEVGTAIDQVFVARRLIDAPAAKKHGTFVSDSLNLFRLDRDGFTSDRLRHLESSRVEVESLRRAEEKANAAKLAAGDALAAAETERKRVAAAAIADELAARRASIAALALALETGWLVSELRAKTLARFHGVWPAFLDVTTTKEPGLPLPQQQWQATLYFQFLDGQTPGRQIWSGDCSAALTVPGVENDECAAIIREWFVSVIAAGYMVAEKKHRFGMVNGVSYKATGRKPKPLGVPLPVTGATRVATPRPAVALCSTCRQPLADMLVAQGRHMLCGAPRPR